jgi:hypothetical protein
VKNKDLFLREIGCKYTANDKFALLHTLWLSSFESIGVCLLVRIRIRFG